MAIEGIPETMLVAQLVEFDQPYEIDDEPTLRPTIPKLPIATCFLHLVIRHVLISWHLF